MTTDYFDWQYPEPNGTCLLGYLKSPWSFEETVGRLLTLSGQHEALGESDKSSFDFAGRFKGATFTLYDYKGGELHPHWRLPLGGDGGTHARRGRVFGGAARGPCDRDAHTLHRPPPLRIRGQHLRLERLADADWRLVARRTGTFSTEQPCQNETKHMSSSDKTRLQTQAEQTVQAVRLAKEYFEETYPPDSAVPQPNLRTKGIVVAAFAWLLRRGRLTP